MKKNNKKNFFIILLFAIAFCYLAVMGLNFEWGRNEVKINSASEMRFGIDIKGGIEAYFKPEDPNYIPTDAELEDARRIFEVRLDARNVLDREIIIDKNNSAIMVRFPFKANEDASNAQSTIDDIGKTAKLEFKDPDGNVIFTGSEVDNSIAEYYNGDKTRGWGVSLSLKPDGTKAFAEATARLKGQSISIYVDDVEISAPTVNDAITEGKCTISGNFTADTAKNLAAQIKSGALPYNMKTDSYNIISPTLGRGALNVMVYAALAALAIILLFMLFYYRVPGGTACIALLMQMAITLMAINYSGLTLTLPGIAGIILTIGIGIDTNIIIIERIREEIRSGKSINSAVDTGFSRALSAVVDANITGMISAVLLMILGTGAIKSFGWTTFIGVLVNLFTSVFLARIMTRSLCCFKGLCTNRMFGAEAGQKCKFNLKVYKKRFTFLTASIVLLVVGLGAAFIPSMSPKLDIQFAGGALFTYSYNGDIDTGEVSRIAKDTLNRELAVSTTKSPSGEQTLVLNIAGKESVNSVTTDELFTKLAEAFPDNNVTVKDIRTVDPFIGKSTLQRGGLAVILASILIVLYVAYRFRRLNSWSLGGFALLALLHDLLFVLAAFIVFRIPINDGFIAVVLTILGYSINDTIIIYDRIRENSKLMKKGTQQEDILDNSINQTMTRSIFTLCTTLVSVFSILIFASIFGIVSIQNFALPLGIGVIAGGYSSVFLAGPLWTMWQKRVQNKAAKA